MFAKTTRYFNLILQIVLVLARENQYLLFLYRFTKISLDYAVNVRE